MKKLDAQLDMHLILNSPNLAMELSDSDLSIISSYCSQGFAMDLQSRVGWEEKMRTAQKLALQVMEEKSFPWEGCSNVKFPLLTIAAIQFHSRAYPALIEAPDLVKCQVFEEDPDGGLMATGSLIEEHMSWQLLEEDEDWEEETDRALLVVPILGCVFKKSLFNKTKGHNESETVLPGDLVVNYWAKSLDDATRITHIQYCMANEFRENVVLGVWLDQNLLDIRQTPAELGPLARAKAEDQGLSPSADDYDQPLIVLEQCCYLDLDGDGYREPYAVTFRHDNNAILRIRAIFFENDIVRNEEGAIARIFVDCCYTKIPFIPSPDGGFYDLGFGMLLGPINQAIDSSINQLIDAGTMSNAGGGFLGKGVRVKGGNYTFTPNEWKRVDSTGDDLSKGIFPLPVREPSPTLFQLLSLLIQYGERIAGATDAVSGENVGQNTKAETMQTMVEQGLKIFSGIYKRIYRALKGEFRKLYRLNARYLEQSQSFISLKDAKKKEILLSAYKLPATVIIPAADPNYMSERQRIEQATMVRQASSEKPALYDELAVERWFLESMRVPGIDSILVKKLPDPSPPVELQIEQVRAQSKQALQAAQLQSDAGEKELDFRAKLLELANEAELNQAKITQLQAQAILFVEEAGTVQKDAEIAAINSEIGLAKIHHEALMKSIDILSKVHERGKKLEQRTVD